MNTSLTIRLPAEMRAALDQAAADRHTTVTGVVQAAVSALLSEGAAADEGPLVVAVRKLYDETDSPYTDADYQMAVHLAYVGETGGQAAVAGIRELRSLLAALDADEDDGLGDLTTPI